MTGRIATLTSENGVAEVLFQDGVFTLGASEQVTPSQLLGWSAEGRLQWEHDGIAEWVADYAAEAPLSRVGHGRSRGAVVIAVAVAVIVLLTSAGIGIAVGGRALERDRARRERRLDEAKRDAETAERKVMMFGEAITDLADRTRQDPSLTDYDPEPSPEPDPAPDPEPQPQPAFAEYCSIHTYYRGGGFSSETAWIHFKTVDARGKTVEEVLGSDQVNMRKEQNALAQTAKRRQLVDSLRRMMRSAGWTELGVADGGAWYEYVFGRAGGD